MKKIFGIFDRRLLIWFHYVLLTLVVISLYYPKQFPTLNLFILLFLILSISDQIIHKILGVD
jgi:hypothetical protein